MNTSLIKTVIVITGLSLSGFSLANTAVEQREAQKIVDNYKLLRSSCMEKEQKAKKVCFSRLKENNKAYVAAKRTLTLNGKSKKLDDTHYVSFL